MPRHHQKRPAARRSFLQNHRHQRYCRKICRSPADNAPRARLRQPPPDCRHRRCRPLCQRQRHAFGLPPHPPWQNHRQEHPVHRYPGRHQAQCSNKGVLRTPAKKRKIKNDRYHRLCPQAVDYCQRHAENLLAPRPVRTDAPTRPHMALHSFPQSRKPRRQSP